MMYKIFTKEKEKMKHSKEQIQAAVEGLTFYNDWRRGGDSDMPAATDIGIWIENAIAELEAYKQPPVSNDDLRDGLYKILRAVCAKDNGVVDTIWIEDHIPIGDFIMGLLDEELPLERMGEEFQILGIKKCPKTYDLFTSYQASNTEALKALADVELVIQEILTLAHKNGVTELSKFKFKQQCNQIRTALTSPQAKTVDVVDWKYAKISSKKDYETGIAKGWNACLDHLVEKGIINAEGKVK